MKFTAYTEDLEDLIVVTIKWDIICMQKTHSCLRLDLLSLVAYLLQVHAAIDRTIDSSVLPTYTLMMGFKTPERGQGRSEVGLKRHPPLAATAIYVRTNVRARQRRVGLGLM